MIRFWVGGRQLIKSTVEPVYYGHLGTNQKCPDYQEVLIFQVISCDLGPQPSVWMMQVFLFKCPH